MRRIGAFLAMWLVGCGVNPLPEPPGAPELVGDVSGDGCSVCDGPLRIVGGPGSVENADHVWAVALDGAEPPVIADVADDGSFEIFVPAQVGEEIRLQARRGSERSEPIDLVARETGVLPSAPRPFADCFALDAELGLDGAAVGASTSRVVTLRNGCAEALTVETIALRAPTPDFTVQAPATPLVLAPNDTVDVPVTFAPSAAGLREEVLLFEVSLPQRDRRPVTVFGRGDP
jgi:hypothetical protein